MIQNPFKKATPIESALIGATVLLLIIFSAFLVRNIQSAHRSGAFSNRISPINDILMKNRETHQMSAKDVEYIDIWMTFSYINFVFNLPPDYLRDDLKIQDTKYPNMPIGNYIKRNNLDKTEFITKVRESVQEYMTLHPNK